MWKIKEIFEADYGCEERMPGEPIRVCVRLQSDYGELVQFEVADSWLLSQELEEGDEWPEDLSDISGDDSDKQFDFMNNYYDALEELEEHIN